MPEARMQDWGELTAAVIHQETPILPRPRWGQDAAFIAFMLDRLSEEVRELQGVVDDLWMCIGQPEIDELHPETRDLAQQVHLALEKQHNG